MLNKTIAVAIDEFIARFFGGYRIVDTESGFELDYAGLKGFDQERVIREKAEDIKRAMGNLELIESGGIANPTENRQVDHYNLRIGEGLEASLRLWKKMLHIYWKP
jgi:glucose-6-phosphate isomerase